MQEAVLDCVERLLAEAISPAVARRLTGPIFERYDAEVTISGERHTIFLRGEVRVEERELKIITLGVVSRPA